MKGAPIVLSQRHVALMEKSFKITLGVSLSILMVAGFRYFRTKSSVSLLTRQIAAQRAALKNLQPQLNVDLQHPVAEDVSASDAVSTVQAGLERSARKSGCSIEEFQASPERAAYLSAFTLDTKEPDWVQVPIQLTLSGPLSATMETVESLKGAGIPVEPDSIEIARRGVSNKGSSIVSLRLLFRILIHTGGAA